MTGTRERIRSTLAEMDRGTDVPRSFLIGLLHEVVADDRGAPQEALVAEGWKLVPDGDPVELDDCPEGLFDFGGRLGFMTEYATVSEKDGRRQRDAYVVASGEYFWGGAKTAQERAKLIVQPLAASPATGGA